MDDRDLIEKYWSRDESAIKDTEVRYGRLLYSVSYGILESNPDSEEWVNDTYLKTWNAIPPVRPFSFKAFIMRIVRNISVNRYRTNRAKKRDSNMEVMLSELEECIPSASDTEAEAENNRLIEVINVWLGSLDPVDRKMFMKRYWAGKKLKDICKSENISLNSVTGKMYRLRGSLRKKLEKEGIVP